MITLTESIGVLEWGRPHDDDPDEEIEKFNVACEMAIKALETMIEIDKAETLEQAVVILTTYLCEVEV